MSRRTQTLARWLATDGRGVAIVALGGAALLAGRWVRYAWVEPEGVAARCEVAAPWWCGLRTALIVLTQWQVLGWAALALCAVGAGWRLAGRSGRASLWAAIVVSGFAMALYNATHGAIAVVGAALLLLTAPRPEHP